MYGLVGDLDDGVSRAEVLLQNFLVNVGIPVPESENVVDSCAAKAVQSLVVVPDNRQRRPPTAIRKEGDQFLLPIVNILVFVNEQVPEAAANLLQSSGVLI